MISCYFLFPFLFQIVLGQQKSICSPYHTYHVNEKEGSAYLFVERLLTANQASEYCKSLGSELVRIPNLETLNLLKSLSRQYFLKNAKPEAEVKFYALSANNLAYRYESSINTNIKYDTITNQFNEDQVNSARYYLLDYLQRLQMLWMHVEATGDFVSPVTFCSYKYDIVVFGQTCPENYKKNFQVYVSTNPSSTDNKLLVYAPKFSTGDIMSTPLLTKMIDDRHLSYDSPKFYIPDYKIFVGARSTQDTHVWVWSNGSLLETSEFFVPFPDSHKCQQLTLPFTYEDGENFKVYNCFKRKAYPVCEFHITADYRQIDCKATSAKLLWHASNPISNQPSLILQYSLRQGEVVLEEKSYSYAESNAVTTSIEERKLYAVLMTLRFPPCQNSEFLFSLNFSLILTPFPSIPKPPQATVFSVSTSVHICHFKIKIPQEVTVMNWQILTGTEQQTLVTIENNFNRDKQYVETIVDLTRYKIKGRKPIYTIKASGCIGDQFSEVSGLCAPPIGLLQKEAELTSDIKKVLKPLRVKPKHPSLGKTYLILCFSSIMCGLISGFVFAHFQYLKDIKKKQNLEDHSDVDLPQEKSSEQKEESGISD